MRNVIISLDIPTSEMGSARPFRLPSVLCALGMVQPASAAVGRACQECHLVVTSYSFYSCPKEPHLPWDIKLVANWVADFHLGTSKATSSEREEKLDQGCYLKRSLSVISQLPGRLGTQLGSVVIAKLSWLASRML